MPIKTNSTCRKRQKGKTFTKTPSPNANSFEVTSGFPGVVRAAILQPCRRSHGLPSHRHQFNSKPTDPNFAFSAITEP
ncbi:hypothetical protein NL676_021138 [Syzygium grande]|nr:hypothetical protein NL676_021138 [Syzygium grande]